MAEQISLNKTRNIGIVAHIDAPLRSLITKCIGASRGKPNFI